MLVAVSMCFCFFLPPAIGKCSQAPMLSLMLSCRSFVESNSLRLFIVTSFCSLFLPALSKSEERSHRAGSSSAACSVVPCNSVYASNHRRTGVLLWLQQRLFVILASAHEAIVLIP